VLMLGHTQILQMVMAIAFGGAMTVELPGYAIESQELWRHSLVAATAGETLVQNGVEIADAATCFTAALLHDVGKLVMGQLLTNDLRDKIRNRIAQGASSVDAEKESFGTNHAEVGACLLEAWRVPEEIVEAVRNHHAPILTPRLQLSCVTHLANCIAHLSGATPGWEAYALRGQERVLQLLDINPEQFQKLLISVRDASERAEQFMNIS
jgi:putative nucleotidyltransferase with HDIG domain